MAGTQDFGQITREVAAKFKELGSAAAGKVRYFTEESLLPALRAYARNGSVARPAPPRSDRAFDFATAKSARFYFYSVAQGAIPTDGRHYVRTRHLTQAWNITIDRRRRDEQILVITNNALSRVTTRKSGDSIFPSAVFGQQAVPGHIETGWGQAKDAFIARVSNRATALTEAGIAHIEDELGRL